MTDNYRDLIAWHLRENDFDLSPLGHDYTPQEVADALEALLAERDAQERLNAHLIYEADTLAAQIAAAKSILLVVDRPRYTTDEDWRGEQVYEAGRILSADPAELLREHDAKVRAEALRDALADLRAYTDSGAPFGHRPVEEFLSNRADRIEKGNADD